MRFALPFSGMCCLLSLAGCTDRPETGTVGNTPAAEQPAYTMDPHSYARPNEAVITHLHLDITVDMDARRIEGSATYDLRRRSGDQVVFDTDGLEIKGVFDADGAVLTHEVGEADPLLGIPLVVDLPAGIDRVRIDYRTGADAAALKWLTAKQTLGGRQPFLFTQGQAILTRSWIPVQDSPGVRFTYTADVQVPVGQIALMSAENPQAMDPTGRYSFRMEQPIPAYLMALAVGDLAFRPLGARSGVYAEPELVEKAAWEFADTESMIEAAEALYGPYRWGRYDVLVLPPSFPFGGMENPRLTFATPTIIAGDRSLTALVAHELAHSWSGNLVTNANWDDFWLNEGFTVYFESRIMEQVHGAEYAAMLDLLGHQDLQRTVNELSDGKHPEDTRLKLDLAGRNPDDGVTDIAYEKGRAFLRMIEERVGRERFDAFVRGYFDAHAFESMTTDRFLEYLDRELLKPAGVEVDVDGWVFGKGLPDDIVVPVSDRFQLVEAEIARWREGTAASELTTSAWTTHEWLHFLRNLPEDMDGTDMKELDERFGFTATGNSEILTAWLQLAIRHDHAAAYDRLDEFLSTMGRRKFLVPLYEELATTDKGMIMAKEIYRNARPGYHAVSVRTLDKLLEWEQFSNISI